MNFEILNEYGIEFRKTSNGMFIVNNGNHENLLAAYIHIYNYPPIIERLLSDIDKALAGNFSEIDNNDYSEDYTTDCIYGEITENMTFELFDEETGEDLSFPLIDIKEIFTSWLVFLRS